VQKVVTTSHAEIVELRETIQALRDELEKERVRHAREQQDIRQTSAANSNNYSKMIVALRQELEAALGAETPTLMLQRADADPSNGYVAACRQKTSRRRTHWTRCFAASSSSAPRRRVRERRTLFLNDESTGELYSRVAEGGAIREIRMMNTSGVAGNVFTTRRRPAIVDDPYSDPRFNADVDKQTGYVTHSLLCAPFAPPKAK